MQHILDQIKNTFEKTAESDLTRYFQRHSGFKGWMIYSDYCLDNKDKANDVVTFSLVPYTGEIEKLNTLIDKRLKTDIKKSRSVHNDAIDLLKSGLFFHISFIIKKNELLKHNPNDNEKENIRKALLEAKDYLELELKKHPSKTPYSEKIIQKIISLLKEMERKSFNLKLLKNILLITLLSSYISYLISKIVKAEQIGWFSDRDKIMAAYNSLAQDFFTLSYHGQIQNAPEKITAAEIMIAVPKEEAGSKNWYDSLNKLPDYIAGTLADWRINDNKVSHNKFLGIIEKCLTEPSTSVILKCHFECQNNQCSRILIKPSPK